MSSRNRPPRSAGLDLLLGIAASVIATASLGIAPIFRNWQVPVWLVVLLGMLFGLVLFQMRRFWQTRGGGRRRVFLLMPAFQQKHWFAAFLQELLVILDGSAFDLVVKIPGDDFSVEHQRRQLKSLANRRTDFSGGFIIAVQPSDSRRDLEKFCSEIGRPVIFTDVRPYERADDYPTNAAFVGTNSEQIGQTAARCLVDDFLSPDPATVLVIGSTAQVARQASFEKELQHLRPTAKVVRRDDGAFDRGRARQIVADELRRTVGKNEAHTSITAIFCTNDEMALGAVDAILASAYEWARRVPVIGVDGTPEARALIEAGGTPLVATLAQDPRKIAIAAWDMLQDKMTGEVIPAEKFIPVEVYPLAPRRLSNRVQVIGDVKGISMHTPKPTP
jgi:ribose transport system substrate-binding protein